MYIVKLNVVGSPRPDALIFYHQAFYNLLNLLQLDFQLAFLGSPAVDLNYFLFGSLNENVRKVHLKFIIHEYQRVLKETLEKLEYQGHIPTLKEIHIELIKNSLIGEFK